MSRQTLDLHDVVRVAGLHARHNSKGFPVIWFPHDAGTSQFKKTDDLKAQWRVSIVASSVFSSGGTRAAKGFFFPGFYLFFNFGYDLSHFVICLYPFSYSNVFFCPFYFFSRSDQK